MTWFTQLLPMMFSAFFTNLYDQLTKIILSELGSLMSFAADSLSLPIVKSGILYAQILASSILLPKAGLEIYKTWILLQEGDPDGDIAGAIVRSVQAMVLIWSIPLLVTVIFTFGTKVNADIAKLNAFDQTYMLTNLTATITVGTGWIIPMAGCVIIILILVVFIQTVIRGADLAGTAVLGAIIATNLTNPNHSAWSSWFRQIFIICTSQGLQLFFLAGAFTVPLQGVRGLLLTLGWMVVTVRAPKYLQQFAYSTGLASAAGGTARTAGTMLTIKMMMGK